MGQIRSYTSLLIRIQTVVFHKDGKEQRWKKIPLRLWFLRSASQLVSQRTSFSPKVYKILGLCIGVRNGEKEKCHFISSFRVSLIGWSRAPTKIILPVIGCSKRFLSSQTDRPLEKHLLWMLLCMYTVFIVVFPSNTDFALFLGLAC